MRLTSANIGHMLGYHRQRCSAVILLTASWGCSDTADTRIVVSVNTDLAPGEQADLLRLTVQREDSAGHPDVSVVEEPLGVDAGQNLPLVVTVTRAKGDAPVIEVTAEARINDVLVVRRAARASYLPGKVLSLPVNLSAICSQRFEVCEADGRTCGDDGQCEDVARGTLEPWRGAPAFSPEPAPDMDAGSVQDATSGAENDASVAVPDRITAVVLGERHSCALQASGVLWCWGGNQSGQLGTTDAPCPVATGPSRSCAVPQIVPVPSVRSVAAGTSFTCAVDEAGTARCWGADELGQRGDGAPPDLLDAGTVDAGTGEAGTPLPGAEPLSALEGVTDVLAGGAFACAVTTTSDTRCWGDNGSRQISADLAQPFFPAPVPSSLTVAAGSLGEQFGCSVREGAVRCFGDDHLGQGGAASPRVGPDEVAIATNAQEVRAGAQHACATRADDHTVACWGRGDLGQLGVSPEDLPSDCDDRGFAVPCATTPRALVPAFVAEGLSLGGLFSCALGKGGEVKCWGSNHNGVVDAASSAIAFSRPTSVPGAPRARLIAAGDKHACVVGVDEQLYCWGSNEFGQLGPDAARSAAVAPVRVPLP